MTAKAFELARKFLYYSVLLAGVWALSSSSFQAIRDSVQGEGLFSSGDALAIALALVTSFTLLIGFALEATWILMRRLPLSESSLCRLLVYNRSREGDGLVGFSFYGGLVGPWFALTALALVTQTTPVLLSWGITPLPASWPGSFWLTAAIVIALDSFLQFALHWASHRVPPLWQLHKIHHSATEMTMLTAFRDHPFFDFLNNFVRGLIMWMIGLEPPVIAIVISLKALQVMLIHSRVDSNWGPFSWILTTPAAHRLHHSTSPEFYNKNFGTDFIVWDRLFRTYAKPRKNHADPIGLPDEPHIAERFYPYSLVMQVIAIFAPKKNQAKK